jgi:hypothetical protein
MLRMVIIVGPARDRPERNAGIVRRRGNFGFKEQPDVFKGRFVESMFRDLSGDGMSLLAPGKCVFDRERKCKNRRPEFSLEFPRRTFSFSVFTHPPQFIRFELDRRAQIGAAPGTTGLAAD